MQYLGAISKMIERFWFVSKPNHSTSQYPKSMPQPLLSKKQKLTGSVKTYSPSRININKYIFFIIGDWNAKVD